MNRPTMMACESEGETISPSGVSEIRRSLDAPAIRASVMKRFILPLMLGIGMLGSAGYFGMYAYYRFIDPDSVIDTFHHNGISIGENSCGDSIVTKFADLMERSIAPTVNDLYEPLATLDNMVNGRSIHFTDEWSYIRRRK